MRMTQSPTLVIEMTVQEAVALVKELGSVPSGQYGAIAQTYKVIMDAIGEIE